MFIITCDVITLLLSIDNTSTLSSDSSLYLLTPTITSNNKRKLIVIIVNYS